MFEKSLGDLIKGLRSHRGKDEAKYVANMLEEIRGEMKSADMDVKAEAILKLAYLQMLGYRLSSASFHILETMASSKYHIKHIGYLAATVCFAEDTDVLILATNLIKKDLHSAQPLDVLAALHGLSHVINQDLAQHLADDIILMLTHSRALVRKRAVLVLHSAITKCPELLERTWERLRDLLCDENQGVVTATVNMICELARRHPEPFVPLSPQLFQILTSTSNNWLLIKVIKLFGALAPVEPRLVRRLLKPITEIISTTPAMSLLYECIHTTIIGGMLQGAGSDALAWQCVENLGHFLNDTDQNLRYIALVALGKLIPTHPHLVAQHQTTILSSIGHPDLTLRLRALDLAFQLADRPGATREIVEALVQFLEEGTDPTMSAASRLAATLADDEAKALEPSGLAMAPGPSITNFRALVVTTILDLGQAKGYAHIDDPTWYMGTLVRLAKLSDADTVPQIVDQLIKVVFHFPDTQEEACALLQPMLLSDDLFDRANPTSELLRAGAAICSECVQYVDDVPRVVYALVQDALQVLPPRIVAVALHSALKLYAFYAASLASEWTSTAKSRLMELTANLTQQLKKFARLNDPEVQERAQEGLQLFGMLHKGLETALADQPAPASPDRDGAWTEPSATAPRALHLLLPLFYTRMDVDVERPPPLPQSMNLRAWIAPEAMWSQLWDVIEPTPAPVAKSRKPRAEQRDRVRVDDQERESSPAPRRDTDSPFYLSASPMPRSKKSSRKKAMPHAPSAAPPPANSTTEANVDDIPIVQLDISDLAGPAVPIDTPTAEARVQPKLVTRKKKSSNRAL